ncbi:MAG: hypothetical protein ACETWM_08585 [Candidatus Lokiarchaeia archaeon]
MVLSSLNRMVEDKILETLVSSLEMGKLIALVLDKQEMSIEIARITICFPQPLRRIWVIYKKREG